MNGPGFEQLTLFPGDSPASRSAWPDNGKAAGMTVSSGQKCLGSYANSGPLGSLVRMLVGSSAWQSELVDLRWKVERLAATRMRITTMRYSFNRKKCCSSRSSKTSVRSGTMSSHLLFRLVPSVRRTDETESRLWLGTMTANQSGSLNHSIRSPERAKGRTPSPVEYARMMLPTPTASDGDHGGPNSRDSSGRPKLQAAAMMWPTPTSQMSKHGVPTEWEIENRPNHLHVMTQLWPTPTANPAPRGQNSQYNDSHHKPHDLANAVKMWPTPTASERATVGNGKAYTTGNGTVRRKNADGSTSNMGLAATVKMYNTPTVNDARSSTLPESQRGRDSLIGDVLEMLPTPNARDWKNATAKEWENPNNTRNLNRRVAHDLEGNTSPEARNGQLNPRWVEWLMGFPIGWTALNASGTRWCLSGAIRTLKPSCRSKRARHAER